ncbi:MAG TPA: hydantoinase/oxoprolinase family protein [Candidatus Binatia bacterium]|nr:hydantoinase/oxoprolinase family protein [Candidatus Binatia bacterium]
MRVGFDIGGTFTDVIVLGDDGRLTTAKVLSLLDRVGEDIVACVQRSAATGQVESFVHGTTIASNAVIENKTATTGLITTRGFRDELEMRGQRRPNIYDVAWDRLPPLVPRSLRLEVRERVLGDGSVEQPLDPKEAQEVIRNLLAAHVEAIAVCLVNAYLNPTHERQIGRLIAEMAPRIVVCLSSDVHPEIREYERTSTTVINASLIPVVDRYLNQLEQHLSAYSRRVLIMQSNGGIMSAQAARRRPAYMIESGPAAGVLAAARLASETGLNQVLSFDMGGTTAKACLIENGVPLEKPGGEVGGGATMTTRLFGGGGHALRVPSLDIVEVGAGGGSIAWIDDGGALRVGPHSAGAEPGPVCYGRGGQEPTVTDANVVLGYMNPEAIAGSTLRINRQAAWEAIEQRLAGPLQLDVLRAAYGITQVANAAMMRALRAVSTERGRDPREFTLIAFGGAGPIHAAALAESLGISRVQIPLFPGLFSALGLLLADYRHDYIRSIALALDSVDPQTTVRQYEELEALAREELLQEGVSEGTIRFECQVDLKYGYQVSELPLPFPSQVKLADLRAELARLFTEAHKQAFGYDRDDAIELVNLRVRALASAGRVRFTDLVAPVSSTEQVQGSSRQAYFGPARGTLETPVRRRADITAEQPGPLIVEEPDTTVVVPPGWSVRRDEQGNLVVTKV